MTNNTTDFKVTGLKTIKKRLDALPAEMQKQAVNFALWKSSEVVHDEVKKQAPFRSGRLRRSIKRQRRKSFGLVTHVDVGSTAPYWHIVEFGAKPAQASGAKGGSGAKVLSGIRGQTLSNTLINSRGGGSDGVFGIRRKGLKARPFLRPAFELSHKQAARTFRDQAAAKIPRIVKKLQRIQAG